jgi:hypothetical protein
MAVFPEISARYNHSWPTVAWHVTSYLTTAVIFPLLFWSDAPSKKPQMYFYKENSTWQNIFVIRALKTHKLLCPSELHNGLCFTVLFQQNWPSKLPQAAKLPISMLEVSRSNFDQNINHWHHFRIFPQFFLSNAHILPLNKPRPHYFQFIPHCHPVIRRLWYLTESLNETNVKYKRAVSGIYIATWQALILATRRRKNHGAR